MSFRVLVIDPSTTMEEIIQQLDSCALIIGAFDPQGGMSAGRIGQLFFNSSTKVSWIATATDGTTLGTTWEAFPAAASLLDLDAGLPNKYITAEIAKQAFDQRPQEYANYVRNQYFKSWLAHPSGTSVALNNSYLADGWLSHKAAGVASIQRLDSGLPAHLSACVRVTRVDDANESTYLEQSLSPDDVIALRGRPITLSAYLRGGSGRTGSVTLRVIAGEGTSEGSTKSGTIVSPVAIIDETYAPTTSWQRTSQADFPGQVASGVVPLSATTLNIVVEMQYAGLVVAGDYVDVSGVCLNVGDDVVPDLTCVRQWFDDEVYGMRYYRKSFKKSVKPGTNQGIDGAVSFRATNVGTFSQFVPLYPPMRTADYSVTLYNPSANNNSAINETDGVSCGISVGQKSEYGFTLTSSSPSASNANDLIRVHYVASAEVDA